MFGINRIDLGNLKALDHNYDTYQTMNAHMILLYI